MVVVANRIEAQHTTAGHGASDIHTTSASQTIENPIKQEIKELSERIDRLLDTIGAGTIDQSLVSEKLKEASQHRTHLQDELGRLSKLSRIRELTESMIIPVLLEQKSRLFSESENEQKAMISDFVEQITVTDNIDDNCINVSMTVRLLHGVEDGT